MKLELEYYPEIDIKMVEKNNPDMQDKIKNSIILYNKALESIRLGNEDMAIIKLKKAVSMNSSFYEAMNLLGLCYYHIGDKKNSHEVLQKVLEAESNSIRALRYIEAMETNSSDDANIKVSKRNRKKNYRARHEIENSNLNIKPKAKPKVIVEIVKYLTGIVIGALIIYFPISEPEIIDNKIEINNINAQLESKNIELNEEKDKYTVLNNDYSNIKKLLESEETKNENIEKEKADILKLINIELIADTESIEEAIDMFLLIDEKLYIGSLADKLALMKKTLISDENLLIIYEEAIELCDADELSKFGEAMKKLDKIVIYNSTFKRDGILYYRAKSLKGLRQYENATKLFNELKEDYPESQLAYWADVRLREIKRLTEE